jgi:hypothetical protein
MAAVRSCLGFLFYSHCVRIWKSYRQTQRQRTPMNQVNKVTEVINRMERNLFYINTLEGFLDADINPSSEG